jgi:hypothetical protein
MANSVDMVDLDVKTVLRNINLSNLFQNFVNANVDDIVVCKSLNDGDLSQLGITTIGDRIRFREEVRRGECAE